MADLTAKCEQLVACLRGLESCAVAFSGGVDSVVVAKAAQLALGDLAIAVTGYSASLAEGELEEARRVAGIIGIRHELIATDEFENPQYTRNAPDRCYHCKSELYSHMERILQRFGLACIVNGANADDLQDYRPGLQAAAEHRVVSPLAECGLNKQSVRQLAAHWGLPVWNKPATPCLSSRVAYGEQVTPERLAMIDRAEQFLQSHQLQGVRVRYHQGDLARIEVSLDYLARLCDPPLRAALIQRFRELGFKFITLDLEGFRSGSLNTLIPVDQLRPVD